MKKYLTLLLLLTAPLCSAEQVTYEKIDDTHVRKITTPDAVIQEFDITDIKNRETDANANIDYKAKSCDAEIIELNQKVEAVKKDLEGAQKAGVKTGGDVLAEPSPNPL